MSQDSTEEAPPSSDGEPELPPEPLMPAWAPVLIGLLLVGMAALAVYTGLKYREMNAMSRLVQPRHPLPNNRNMSSAPPGEPSPGASLVYPGDADNVPTASEPVTGHARAEIAGGGQGGISLKVRMWAKRGMITTIVPDEALIYVNDLAVGQAKQFATMDDVYDFPAAGSYTIRVVAPGFKERQFVVTAAADAPQEIAKIEATLERQ